MEDLKYLIPGAVQGFVRSLISYPFEVIKTQMQIQNKSTFKTIKYIYKNDIFKFYRGIGVPLVQIPFERSIQFYIYEKTKENNNIFTNSILTSFLTNSIFAPFSIFQVNIMNTNKNNYKNMKNFFMKSPKNKILYKGISLEISKNYFSTFTYFYIYSFMQTNLKFENYYYKTFTSGVLSSIGVWLVVLPYDTIKIKYQTSDYKLKDILLSLNKNNYKNLWKGLTPIVLRTFPSSGLGMICYEYTKKN